MSESLDFILIFSGMILAGAGLTALLITLMMPVLKAYALARPNARSSHKVPTPQGGGLAILIVVYGLSATILLWTGQTEAISRLSWLAGATAFIAIIGAFDDIRPLPVMPRLLAQIGMVAIAILMTRSGDAVRIFPTVLPQWIENVILIFAGVWFVNLVNFMDGLDWLSVAEIVPITVALLLLQTVGYIPFETVVVAAALLGGMLGFAFFNKPVAKLFMGDVGSLPIGLMLGWMLLQLAQTGALIAALILPLYYLMDATITLFLRWRRGEKLSQAHRSHFYQRATTNGYSVFEIVTTVFLLNLLLGLMAAGTYLLPRFVVAVWVGQILLLVAAIAAVSLILYRFSKPKNGKEMSHA